MNLEILKFILFFTIGLIYYRFLFFFFPNYFKKPIVRTILKLPWHHNHHGAVLVLIGECILLLTNMKNLSIVFIGLGLGFIFDLIVDQLRAKSDRESELKIYGQTLIPTLFIWLVIAGLIISISLI